MRYVFIVTIGVLLGFCSCTENTTPTEDVATVIGPHEEQHLKNKGAQLTESQWDSINNYVPPTRALAPAIRHKNYKTFGWHMYSNGTAYKYYNYELLWGLSYFSYEVNPDDGTYKTVHNWKTTPLIDSAKRHNCKVYLTISNFGGSNNAKFLNNSDAHKTLADNVIELLKLRQAHGVNMDFESVSGRDKTALSTFIIYLSKRLKAENPSYSFTLALYSVDWNKVFEINKIDDHVDLYTLMAYDYYGSFSKTAGPVAPLHASKAFGSLSVANSVKYYLDAGVSKDKLIVGMPYYGAEWSTESKSIPSTVKKFIAHPTVNSVKNDHTLPTAGFDSLSATSYYIFEKDGQTRQLWYDDSLSLSQKYIWLKEQKLAGAGFWALGYSNGDPALWDLLGKAFGQPK